MPQTNMRSEIFSPIYISIWWRCTPSSHSKYVKCASNHVSLLLSTKHLSLLAHPKRLFFIVLRSSWFCANLEPRLSLFSSLVVDDNGYVKNRRQYIIIKVKQARAFFFFCCFCNQSVIKHQLRDSWGQFVVQRIVLNHKVQLIVENNAEKAKVKVKSTTIHFST